MSDLNEIVQDELDAPETVEEEFTQVDRSYALSEAAELLSICALESYDRKDVNGMLEVTKGWMALAGMMDNDSYIQSNVNSIGFVLPNKED